MGTLPGFLKKKNVEASPVFIFILFFIFSSSCLAASFQKVCIENVCLEAEVVSSANDIEQGLMFRHNLGPDQGMLFMLGQEAIHTFWMKNMRFALDIIWIDKDKRIVDISKNVLPCAGDPCPNIFPQQKSQFVLEVKAGYTDKNNVKIGQIVNF